MLVTACLTSTILVSASEREEQHSRQIFREVTETYIDRSYGFSIDLARDFNLSSEQGDLLFFKSPDRAGTVIIRPRPGLTLSTVQAAMRSGFESKVITLTPTGVPMTLNVNDGQGMAMEVTGSIEGREVRGTMAGIFGGDQQGYMVLVGSVSERWMGFENSALTMLNSFSINPVEPGYEFERWQQRLAGNRLIFVQGYGNYHVGGGMVSEYHFCSDGTYRQRTDTTDTYTGAWRRGTYGTTSKGKGTWQVQYRNQLPLVTMYSRSGNQNNLPITDKEGYVFLGGAPYRFAQNTLCP
jgi:hypothetical protein